ncbi:extracellular zinc metalloproteinase [Lactiplantibacillus plantarum]|nr:extracellular zinc metalloproteinase [Lactiplantibacillus plantarum]
MRVNKGLLSVIAVTTVASLGGLTTTATAATKKVTTTYSSQSHTLIIRGQTRLKLSG